MDQWVAWLAQRRLDLGMVGKLGGLAAHRHPPKAAR
jgi:hypothetical protein